MPTDEDGHGRSPGEGGGHTVPAGSGPAVPGPATSDGGSPPTEPSAGASAPAPGAGEAATTTADPAPPPSGTETAAGAPASATGTGPTPPEGRRPGRLRRLRDRFNANSVADRIAIAALALTLVSLLSPVLKSGAEKVAETVAPDKSPTAQGQSPTVPDKSPVKLEAVAYNDPCLSTWIVTPGHHPEFDQGVASGADEGLADRLTAWEREGSLTHHSEVKAVVNAFSNKDRSVQLRDISITVTARAAPLPGRLAPQIACGDSFNEGLYVDLDTLPVGLPVSYQHLQSSPQQAAARAEAAKHNDGDISLPYTFSKESFLSLVITGRSLAHYTEWHATLTWWDGEEARTTEVSNGGRPFRVTASKPPAGAP